MTPENNPSPASALALAPCSPSELREYRDAMVRARRERNARVTMMSDKHVVVLIDGEEYTMPTGDFIRIAENTLKHGSTLTRSA